MFLYKMYIPLLVAGFEYLEIEKNKNCVLGVRVLTCQSVDPGSNSL